MKLLQFVLIIFFLTSFSLAQSGWFKQKSGTTENLNAVFFTNIYNGIIVGANGTLLRTTDGGTNWVKLLSSTTNNLKKILFADSLSGIIIGDNGTIITTRDGGTTWNNPLSAIEYSFADLSFIDANNGIAVGTSFPNIIYKTTDGGLTWNRISELNIASFKPERIHQDDFNIVVIGLSYGYSEVYQSINDGKSWQLVFSEGGDGYTDAYFFDSKTGYLLTQSGSFAQYNSSVYKTTDGGKSWIVATPFSYRLPAFLLNKIRFVNETTGFIVGSKGVI
ncbi:MAG: YCF48-related protein, partial [Ignavibacteria bacterium]|nr:YCF48-related protein [Ignavibacteria bacterium]